MISGGVCLGGGGVGWNQLAASGPNPGWPAAGSSRSSNRRFCPAACLGPSGFAALPGMRCCCCKDGDFSRFDVERCCGGGTPPYPPPLGLAPVCSLCLALSISAEIPLPYPPAAAPKLAASRSIFLSSSATRLTLLSPAPPARFCLFRAGSVTTHALLALAQRLHGPVPVGSTSGGSGSQRTLSARQGSQARCFFEAEWGLESAPAASGLGPGLWEGFAGCGSVSGAEADGRAWAEASERGWSVVVC